MVEVAILAQPGVQGTENRVLEVDGADEGMDGVLEGVIEGVLQIVCGNFQLDFLLGLDCIFQHFVAFGRPGLPRGGQRLIQRQEGRGIPNVLRHIIHDSI